MAVELQERWLRHGMGHHASWPGCGEAEDRRRGRPELARSSASDGGVERCFVWFYDRAICWYACAPTVL